MNEIKYPEIVAEIKLKNGYKDYFTFFPTFLEDSSDDSISRKFRPYTNIRWESFKANIYFTQKSGKDWVETIKEAEKKILRMKRINSSKIIGIVVNFPYPIVNEPKY